MSRDQNVHPEILDGLEYESQFIQNTSGAQRRDVKLDRGDSWLVRYLPAKLGPNGRFYARIAKHWFNMKAVICPRMTEEAFGGDPNAYCAVCDLSDHLNADRNEDVSKFGFKLRGTPNWLTYCAVFEKAIKGGASQQMPMPEVLQPYLHQHYKNSWEELTAYVRQGARRCRDSILDFEKGNDVFLSKTAKGLRLDKQDSAPIFDLNDPKFNEYCDKLLAACKDPTVKMPSEKQMNDFAAKAEEEAENLARGNSRAAGRGEGRGGRSYPRGGEQEGGGDEDDLPPDDAPPRGGSRYQPRQDDGGQEQDAPPPRGRAPVQEAPPARRTAPPTQEAAQAPARRTAPPAAQTTAAPARRPAPAPTRAPEPPPQDDPPQDDGQGDPNDQGGDQNDQGDQSPADEQPPVRPSASRTQATRTPPPAPARQVPPAPARGNQPPPAPARGGAPRGGAVATESIDEHEHVPEERNDQAPPTALVDPADDPSNAGASEEPPPVDNARRGGYGNSIRNKIAAANNSTRK